LNILLTHPLSQGKKMNRSKTMQEKIKEIAKRVKELREISDVSVEDISSELGISTEKYLSYESGSEDFPASLIVEISHRLKVETSELLTGKPAHMSIFTVTRAGKGVRVDRRADYRYQSLASNMIHKKAEPFLVAVDPKPANVPVPLNAHPGQEFNFVLGGKLKVVIHGNEVILEEGDSIYFDSSFNHGMAAVDGKPAIFLAIIF
jgi:transcriptional regulator with XRE-family HTH domain